MKIAVFHTGMGNGVAWSVSDGIVSTLRTMGHEVLNCSNAKDGQYAQLPPISQISTCDVILLSGPEWYRDRLDSQYGPFWATLRKPKVAWYCESFHRDDRDFDFNLLKPWADFHCFPAHQDAVEFDGYWIPFGVDTEIFKPAETPKEYDAAFCGSLYPKRIAYLSRIKHPLTKLHAVGKEGSWREKTEQLAESYRRTKVFLNLPALSRLSVTKVTEVLACGTFLLQPLQDHPSAKTNDLVFRHLAHLHYYDASYPAQLGELVQNYLASDAVREEIATSGAEFVREHHSLTQRLSYILEVVICGRH